jgi:hypothetical protein
LRARNRGVTRPSEARIVITSGNSVTIPNPRMNGAATPKYLSAVMIGARSWRWRLSSTRRARGSTH